MSHDKNLMLKIADVLILCWFLANEILYLFFLHLLIST